MRFGNNLAISEKGCESSKPTPTRLLEYINSIFYNAHCHQRLAIGDFVFVAASARCFDNFEAASRRPTRLLHNPRLDVDALTLKTARVIVSQLPLLGLLRISIDWAIEDNQHLLVASLCTGSRAIPIYWRAYTTRDLKACRSSYERDFARTPICEMLTQIPEIV